MAWEGPNWQRALQHEMEELAASAAKARSAAPRATRQTTLPAAPRCAAQRRRRRHLLCRAVREYRSGAEAAARAGLPALRYNNTVVAKAGCTKVGLTPALGASGRAVPRE